jgi:ABC-type phosphate transport system auxiliary subunit
MSFAWAGGGQQLAVSATKQVLATTAAAACCQERVQRVRNLLPEAYRLHQDNCTVVQDVLDRFAMAFTHPSEEMR